MVLFIILVIPYSIQFQINDLAIFFVKYIYHVPPSHIICAFRIWVIGLLCMNAVREYFDFMRHRSKFRKTNLLLLIGIIVMEYAIVWNQKESILCFSLDLFEQVYFEEKAIFFMSALAGLFILGFIKIGISDIIGKVKEMKERKTLKILRE